MRVVRHRKLSEEFLRVLEHEADLIVSLKSYKMLAEEGGVPLGTVQQVMAQLIRERRLGITVTHRVVVPRGTQVLEV